MAMTIATENEIAMGFLGFLVGCILMACITYALSFSKPTPQHTDQLVGKWFQSYDLMPFEAQTDDSGKWVVGKTGNVVALVDPGLYLIAYDDDPGDLTIRIKNFYRWRFFPTEAELLSFAEGQE